MFNYFTFMCGNAIFEFEYSRYDNNLAKIKNTILNEKEIINRGHFKARHAAGVTVKCDRI